MSPQQNVKKGKNVKRIIVIYRWVRDNIYILQNATPLILLLSGIGLLIASIVVRNVVVLIGALVCWAIVWFTSPIESA